MAWLIIPYMSFVARMHGSAWCNIPAFMVAFLFTIPVGLLAYPNYIVVLMIWIWSSAWFQTGHGTALAMGRQPSVAQSGRKQFLSPVIDRLCELFNQPLGGKFYCWMFMGLKGFLIMPPLALLWPIAYEFGWQYNERVNNKIDPTAMGELISGAFAGIVVFLLI